MKQVKPLTILSHDCKGPLSSFNLYIAAAPMKGSTPNIKLIALYFPVLCIIHPANTEPADIDKLLGRRWRPESVGNG